MDVVLYISLSLKKRKLLEKAFGKKRKEKVPHSQSIRMEMGVDDVAFSRILLVEPVDGLFNCSNHWFRPLENFPDFLPSNQLFPASFFYSSFSLSFVSFNSSFLTF